MDDAVVPPDSTPCGGNCKWDVRLVQSRLGQHDGRLDLAVRDRPVSLQQQPLALGRDLLEAVTAIEVDRPSGGGPGADEHPALGRAREMLEQRAADAAPLAPR